MAVLWEATQTPHTVDSHAGIPVTFTIPTSALANAKLGAPDGTLKVSATVEGKPFEALFRLRVYAGSRAEDEVDEEDEVPTDEHPCSSRLSRREAEV